MFSVEQSVPEQLNYCYFITVTDLQRVVVTPYENRLWMFDSTNCKLSYWNIKLYRNSAVSSHFVNFCCEAWNCSYLRLIIWLYLYNYGILIEITII